MFETIITVLKGTVEWQQYEKFGLWNANTLGAIGVVTTSCLEMWGLWQQGRTIWKLRSGESVSVTMFNYTAWYFLFCGIYGAHINSHCSDIQRVHDRTDPASDFGRTLEVQGVPLVGECSRLRVPAATTHDGARATALEGNDLRVALAWHRLRNGSRTARALEDQQSGRRGYSIIQRLLHRSNGVDGVRLFDRRSSAHFQPERHHGYHRHNDRSVVQVPASRAECSAPSFGAVKSDTKGLAMSARPFAILIHRCRN